jgi:cell division protein FtsB
MRVVRLLGKLSVVAMSLLVLTLVAIQYDKIIVRNVGLQHTVNSTRADVQTLRERERKERLQIERLSDPEGVVPEIHDRLHFVSPREELIYVKGMPSAAPTSLAR